MNFSPPLFDLALNFRESSAATENSQTLLSAVLRQMDSKKTIEWSSLGVINDHHESQRCKSYHFYSKIRTS